MKGLKHYRLEIIVALAVYGVIWLLQRNEPASTFISNVLEKVGVIIIAALAGLISFIVRRWQAVQLIRMAHEAPQSEVQEPVAQLLQKQLRSLRQDVESLAGKQGFECSREVMNQLSAACFGANIGWHYLGTDSHVPSVYMDLYPMYLEEHLQSSVRSRRFADYRFLLVTEEELRGDFQKNPLLFEEFYGKHVMRGVKLLQVDPVQAEANRARFHLSSAEVGLFGAGFVAFFSPTRWKFRIWLQPLSERRGAMREFFIALNAAAREIRIENGTLKLVRTSTDKEADDMNIRECLA